MLARRDIDCPMDTFWCELAVAGEAQHVVFMCVRVH